MRRPETMRFLGGFHAFPGGALDPSDHSNEAEAVSVLSREAAAAQLGGDAGEYPAFGFFVCALRELFEEIGILLATGSGEAREIDPAELGRARRRLLRGEDTLPRIASSLGIRLATHRLRYLSRWIAPEALPVRFDLRVFAAEAAGEPDPDPREVEAVEWHTPGGILARAEAGTVWLAPPTVATINLVASFPTVEALLSGAAERRDAGAIERHSPLVGRIVAPNASLMTGPGTNTYLVGTDEIVVVDPGSMEPGHLRTIASAGRVAAVVITHSHSDHLSGALDLAEATGAVLAASHRFWDRAALRSSGRHLAEGDTVEVSGAVLTVLETPGHASDHISLWLPSERALFSGDLILGEGTSVISPPDGDLVAYLESLRKVAALHPERLYPGHFAPREDAGEWIAWYLAHRLEREEQILDALAAGTRSIPEIVAEAYRGYPSELHPIAERSVLAHLIKLEGEGRVEGADGVWWLTG